MISIRGWSQTAQFIAVEGGTQFDWAVEGGSLQVTLVGAREPTDVTIRRASPDFLAMRKIAATDSIYVFEAIPFGTFGIRAANRFGKSQVATVTFTATQALQHVRLEFPDK